MSRGHGTLATITYYGLNGVSDSARLFHREAERPCVVAYSPVPADHRQHFRRRVEKLDGCQVDGVESPNGLERKWATRSLEYHVGDSDHRAPARERVDAQQCIALLRRGNTTGAAGSHHGAPALGDRQRRRDVDAGRREGAKRCRVAFQERRDRDLPVATVFVDQLCRAAGRQPDPFPLWPISERMTSLQRRANRGRRQPAAAFHCRWREFRHDSTVISDEYALTGGHPPEVATEVVTKFSNRTSLQRSRFCCWFSNTRSAGEPSLRTFAT